MELLSLQRILIDGGLLSLSLGILIVGSLILNARLWLQDYPKEVRDKVPPLSTQEKRAQKLMMLPVMALMIGVPLYSTYLLRVENGGTLPFITAYLNAFLVLHMFNLFDAVVLDVLLLSVMKPQFAILPNTEIADYHFDDWGMQFKNYLKGLVFCAVFALPLAAVALLLAV